MENNKLTKLQLGLMAFIIIMALISIAISLQKGESWIWQVIAITWILDGMVLRARDLE